MAVLLRLATGMKLANPPPAPMKHLMKLLPLLIFLAAPACVDLALEESEVSLSSSGGEVSLEWVIVSDDKVISCVDAGASHIEVAVLGETIGRERTSCFGGFAVLNAEGVGDSIVEVSLLDPAGTPIVIVELGEVELLAGTTIPLGAVEFPL